MAMLKSFATVSVYALVASLVGLLFYPIVIEQPVTIIDFMLSNKKFVTDGAVITTIEAVVGIFTSIYLLDNYFKPKAKRKKAVFMLKVIPGVLFIIAIAYFELLFFKFRVGEEFISTALIYSAIVFSTVMFFSQILRYSIKAESMKLELKILLNIGILAIGLLVNSTIADYNLSYAETVIEWKALFTLFGIVVLLFIVGIYLPKTKIKSLFKPKHK
ncbi:MAG: hypothetical protein IMY73_00155 [Bacteroidetes bacterium]|nr:hypothetical protein [Bacteroidota bacterium]